MNTRLKGYVYGLTGAFVGATVAYAAAMMSYNEGGLFPGQFLMWLCCGGLAGWGVGVKAGRRLLARQLLRVSITVATIILLTVLIDHWVYS